jgi:hypothetical protein
MLSLLLAALAVTADTTRQGSDSVAIPSGPVRRAIFAPPDSAQPTRRRAVTLSDAYYTRLTVHRYASYAELPVFAAEYWLGQKLMATGVPVADWVKPTHVGVAAGLGGLFALNTVTGVWNLVEGWQQFGDRKPLVVIHSVLMLGADAGFAIAPLVVHGRSIDSERQHRAIALVSMSAATVSTVMMWVAKAR